MTPSRRGRMAMMLPGVRPSMAWASAPTFSSLPVFLSSATTEGSFKTMPLPFTYTKTEAVPRSIPISFAMDITSTSLFFLSVIMNGFPAYNHTFYIILTAFRECKSIMFTFPGIGRQISGENLLSLTSGPSPGGRGPHRRTPRHPLPPPARPYCTPSTWLRWCIRRQ